MAVRMIYGVPGSGKSFMATQQVLLPALRKGRKVITNLSLNIDYLVEILEIDPDLIQVVKSERGDFSDTFLNVEDYKDDWRDDKGRAPLIIVDEAHFALNKQRKKEEVLDIENFFSTHRQAGYDIYLITQDYNRIPRDILGFVEIYYEVMKQKTMGSNVFTYYVRDSDRKMIGNKTKTYEKEIFKCYKSHLLSDGEVEEDLDAVGVKLVWFRWPFVLLGLVILIMAIGFTFFGWSFNPFAFLNERENAQLKENVELDKIEFVDVGSPVINKPAVVSDSSIIEPVEIVEVVEKPKEIKYLKQDHPLDNKLFQITTWLGNTALVNIYEKETRLKVSSIYHTDLENMGYTLEKYSDCSMKLTYENINFFIDCSEIKPVEETTTDQIFNNVPTL
ncbi:TPA: zonular occludens toxin domain-containing protein [Vibrio campbellii]